MPQLPEQAQLRPINRDTFSTPEGDITITWPAGISHTSLEDAYDWLDLVRRKMGRAAGGPGLSKSPLTPFGESLLQDGEALQKALEDVAGWERSACNYAKNMEYYRGLLDQIGSIIGEAAYTCDDGSKSEDVLRAKLPELVRGLVGPAVAPDSLQELRWQYDKQIGELRMRLDAVGADKLNPITPAGEAAKWIATPTPITEEDQRRGLELAKEFGLVADAVPTLQKANNNVTAEDRWIVNAKSKIQAQMAKERAEIKGEYARRNASEVKEHEDIRQGIKRQIDASMAEHLDPASERNVNSTIAGNEAMTEHIKREQAESEDQRSARRRVDSIIKDAESGKPVVFLQETISPEMQAHIERCAEKARDINKAIENAPRVKHGGALGQSLDNPLPDDGMPW